MFGQKSGKSKINIATMIGYCKTDSTIKTMKIIKILRALSYISYYTTFVIRACIYYLCEL